MRQQSHDFFVATSSPPTCWNSSSCVRAWQLVVFAYMVWPVLSIRIIPKVASPQVKFFWIHLNFTIGGGFFYIIVNNDSISCPSWLSEIQSYGLHGRPPPRLQVLLSFGDECLDPQRQRRTLTVQVTAHTNVLALILKHCLIISPTSCLLIVLPFVSFCTWVQWNVIFAGLKVQSWKFSVVWKVKNQTRKLKHGLWRSVGTSSHHVRCVS